MVINEFQKAVEEFLRLPEEEQRRRIEDASRRAREISDAFDRAISFTDEEARRLLRMPMTI